MSQHLLLMQLNTALAKSKLPSVTWIASFLPQYKAEKIFEMLWAASQNPVVSGCIVVACPLLSHVRKRRFFYNMWHELSYFEWKVGQQMYESLCFFFFKNSRTILDVILFSFSLPLSSFKSEIPKGLCSTCFMILRELCSVDGIWYRFAIGKYRSGFSFKWYKFVSFNFLCKKLLKIPFRRKFSQAFPSNPTVFRCIWTFFFVKI